MLLLLLIVHLLLLTYTLFTLWPEMVVYPYLFNNGFTLYQDLIIPYPPTLIWLLALFTKIVGYEREVFQLLTWAIIIVCDLLIYKLSHLLSKSKKIALLSTTFFVLTSTLFSINGLWFDLVQTPLLLLSTYFFAKKRIFLSAIFLAISFFLKQQALWLILWFSAVLIWQHGQNIKPLVIKLFIFLSPLLVTLIFIATLPGFYDWAIYFPFFQSSYMPGYKLFPSIKQTFPILALGIFFLPTVLSRNLKTSFFALSGLVALLFAYPRFDYFHFVPAIAIFTLGIGQNVKSFKTVRIPVKAVSLLGLIMVVFFFGRYIVRNKTDEVRFFDDDHLKATQFLKEKIPDRKFVYVQNGPDQLLPATGLLPLKPWADEFPWYLERIPGAKTSKIDDIVANSLATEKPEYIIYKPYSGEAEYSLGAYRPKAIANYIENNYENYLQITNTLWLKKIKK